LKNENNIPIIILTVIPSKAESQKLLYDPPSGTVSGRLTERAPVSNKLSCKVNIFIGHEMGEEKW